MAIRILIPTPLQKLIGNKQEEEISREENVIGLIDELNTQYPGVKERICDENGTLRKFINIYVNGEDIRFLEGDKTDIPDGAEVSIVPAIAGG